MNILLLGANSPLGTEVYKEAKRRSHKITPFYFSKKPPFVADNAKCVDLSTIEELRRFTLDTFPDAIINCVQIDNHQNIDKNPELSYKLNVELPKFLAQVANHIGAINLHISSIQVFNGKNDIYFPSDKTYPQNTYAKQKSIAEEEVLAYGASSSVVLRIPQMLANSSCEKVSLNEKLFTMWKNGQTIYALNDKKSCFCEAENIAEVLIELAERRNLTGIYHYSSNQSLTQYETYSQIFSYFGINHTSFLKAKNFDEYPIDEKPFFGTLSIEPLLSKLRTTPSSLADILQTMLIPSYAKDLYFKTTGKIAPMKILKKGVDF